MEKKDLTDACNELADTLCLGSLLEKLRLEHGGYELIDHWQQGEFHHDVLVRVERLPGLPGGFLVIATNCNGGVKEVLAFRELPRRSALWHFRCPDVKEFEGELPPISERVVTPHWFDPSELLQPDARSELKTEFRVRQEGGGWCAR
jgi:hypothetical protein